MMFEALQLHAVPHSHVLVFYYASFEQSEVFKKLGIPAHSKYNGVPLSLRPPHKVSEYEVDIFGQRQGKHLTLKCLSEEVIAFSIHKRFLEPLTGFEDDQGLCMISSQTLAAMRPNSFVNIFEDQPWVDDKLLLSPSCIINSFLILDVEKPYEELGYVKFLSVHSNHSKPLLDDATASFIKIRRIETIHMMCDCFTDIRGLSSQHGTLPLFHYTSLHAAAIIVKKGLRMNSIDHSHHDIANIFAGVGGRVGSTNGGGVYFTTKSPASYGVGTKSYEVNLLKDLYNIENVEKFRGSGKVSVVIVYGCSSNVLDQVNFLNIRLFT
jgi:hypothetical protein